MHDPRTCGAPIAGGAMSDRAAAASRLITIAGFGGRSCATAFDALLEIVHAGCARPEPA